MVADYHYFIPSEAPPSLPRVVDKVVEERGMVVWHPPPSYTSVCTTTDNLKNDDHGDHNEEEDTDLLNLRFLSLHYPPLEPTRVISLPTQSIPRPLDSMDYPRDRWDRDDGRSQHQLTYYDSESDSLDSTGPPFNLEPFPSSYDTNQSQPLYEHHRVEVRIEEIQSSEESQSDVSDTYPEEDHPRNRARTFSPPPQAQAQFQLQSQSQRLIPFEDHQYIDETPLISPARYHQYTSPTPTQFATSQLSYEPDSRSASVSRSPESGNLIDHPSADVDQFFDFDAACAPARQQGQYETGYGSKRRVEEIDDDSEEDEDEIELRVEKRVRMRSPRRSPPLFHGPRPVPKPELKPDPEPQIHHDRIAASTDTTQAQSGTPQPRGRKRSLEQSGHDSVETVLKRPFRTPAPRVVLPKVTPKAGSSPQSTPSRPTSKPPNRNLGFRSAPTRLPLAPSTRQSSPAPASASDDPQDFFDFLRAKTESGLPKLLPNTNINPKPATKKVKAFKPPLLKPSDGLSSSNRPNRPNGKGESVMATINKLEKEARTLRQAVRYHTNPDEDERLSEMITQWRNAGREVVEQIFDRIPKPDPSSTGTQAQAQGHGHGHGHGHGSSDWFTGTGDTAREFEMQMTEEQENFLKYCPRNGDGEPVDSDGNSLIPNIGDFDLDKLIEEEGKGRRGESEDYIPTYRNGMSGTRIKKNVEVEVEPKEWNLGTMMLRFSVDPALLGWDDDLEDWADVDNSA